MFIEIICLQWQKQNYCEAYQRSMFVYFNHDSDLSLTLTIPLKIPLRFP